eukprot:3437605-Rhodomonas_salina.1
MHTIPRVFALFLACIACASHALGANAASSLSASHGLSIATAHFAKVDRELQVPFEAANVTPAEARRAFSNCQGGLCLCTEDTYTPSCILTCFAPITCNANGRCLGEAGMCKCFDGWSGSNCDIPPSSTPKDTTT